MFQNLHTVFISCFICLCLQLCFEFGQTQKPTNEDLRVERKSPVSSYFRHSIYGPNTYAFGFEVNDKTTGNIQFRDEKRYSNGSIEGSFGYVRPDGSVSITQFTADPDNGYLSQTQNFPPGEETKWVHSWHTRKPNLIVEQAEESTKPIVTNDDKGKLNLTSILLPVEEINKQHGIDLSPPLLEKELVNPAVLEVINGEAPFVGNNYERKNNEGFGFATVNKFIPSQFPIVPFELPHGDVSKPHSAKDKFRDDEKIKSDSALGKYNLHKVNNFEKKQIAKTPDLNPAARARENNNEKSMPVDMLRTTPDRFAKEEMNVDVEARSVPSQDRDWYDQIINKAREKYLRDLK